MHAGSVSERMELGKVIDREEDFIYLTRLMDRVQPAINPTQRNELTCYAALNAYKIINENEVSR